ncbi:Gibberellin 2-beta-dioxygenase protein [Dioscorea alata]|uniref:Gibberellin 2-beta-dioxygenase protein n=1 Tax=Dioscorea alata TaxID=55571 RepID=A0ACB7V005_DIOAL|nr:Gibberellin 2-beta-dioxygenase protein [Dioscorea alata]
MVVLSVMPMHSDQHHNNIVPVPIIDMSTRRDMKVELILKACEDFGFFQVINHGIPDKVIARMEKFGMDFFSLPASEKLLAGPANPFGYGTKSIGSNGDTGDLEYLLLHSNPMFVSQRARAISPNNPKEFSYVVNEYVGEVRELACEILDLIAQGLGLKDCGVFSSMIRDIDSDSLFRLNHYPPSPSPSPSPFSCKSTSTTNTAKIRFGEHSDPQIITILHSNNVAGLQILSASSAGSLWIPIMPNPAAFCVNVGDVLQAMTNGRLVSVRHRVMGNKSNGARMSTAFFGAPPLHAWISPMPETITRFRPCCYKSFTWSEFKKVMYSLRLGHDRLDLFRLDYNIHDDDDEEEEEEYYSCE